MISPVHNENQPTTAKQHKNEQQIHALGNQCHINTSTTIHSANPKDALLYILVRLSCVVLGWHKWSYMIVTAVQIANIMLALAVLVALVVVAVLAAMLVAAMASSDAAGGSSGLLRNSYRCSCNTVSTFDMCVSRQQAQCSGKHLLQTQMLCLATCPEIERFRANLKTPTAWNIAT